MRQAEAHTTNGYRSKCGHSSPQRRAGVAQRMLKLPESSRNIQNAYYALPSKSICALSSKDYNNKRHRSCPICHHRYDRNCSVLTSRGSICVYAICTRLPHFQDAALSIIHAVEFLCFRSEATRRILPPFGGRLGSDRDLTATVVTSTAAVGSNDATTIRIASCLCV
jgi:hypothetical protein